MLHRSNLKIPSTESIASKENFHKSTKSYVSSQSSSSLLLAKCARCNSPFVDYEIFVNIENKTFHHDCFRCAQCFCPLHNKVHYVIDGRNYCEYDFKVLYAPSCVKCGQFVTGRVINAVNTNWHPECLRCSQCGTMLDSEGVWCKNDQILCQSCNTLTNSKNEKRCYKCNTSIERGAEVYYRDNIYHSYHFNCANCRIELDVNARCLQNKLYCQQCYDSQCSICAACRHPIDNERSIFAVGKYWHVDHFLCAKCEKPFYGSKYIEKGNRAYCNNCYAKCFADICFKCNAALLGNSLKVFGKCWCPRCYACSTCDRVLNPKSKVIEWDMRPICKKCFDRLPEGMKQRMIL